MSDTQDAPLCNIKREGALKRYKIAGLVLVIGACLTGYLNLYHSHDFYLRLILFPVFWTAFVAGGQAPARTCVVNAVLGVDEDKALKLKPIRSQEKIYALRMRALGMVFVSSVIGTVFGLLAFLSSRIGVDCSQATTCSLYYV